MPTRKKPTQASIDRWKNIEKLENAIKLVSDARGIHPQELLINPTPYSKEMLVGDNTPLGGSTAIVRALTKVLSGLKEKRMSDLPFYGGVVVPFGESIELADRTVTSLFMEGQAQAQFIGPKTKNLLSSAMSVGEDVYPVRVAANSYVIHYIDQAASDRALSLAGVASLTKKAEITRRGIAEILNNYSAFGDPDVGITGFYNNAGVPVVTSAYDPYNASTTVQQDIDFVEGEISFIVNNQNLNSSNIVMYVPYNMYAKWATKFDDTLRRSALSVITESLGPLGLEAIIPLNESQRGTNSTNLPAAIGTPGYDRVVTTIRDDMFISQNATPLGQWPQVQLTTGYEVPLYQGMSPCMYHNTTGTRYSEVVVKP